MQSMENTISEVHSLLIKFEKIIKRNKQPIVGASSTPQVMAIQGQQYPHNLLKPLPLIPDSRSRRVIPFDYFINNDLEYLRGGASDRKYTTFVTKTKAADYRHIKHVSNKGASYFITFTDDYSRYGYDDLLKHKHEVFETFKSAARILNMVPTKKVEKTPYELWHGKVPNLSYLKVWGYPKETMGYYFYYPPKNKIVVERYAYFLEKDFILQKESGRIVELEDEDILPSENTAPIVSQEKDVILVLEEHSLGDPNEPANYKAALSDLEFEKWLVAMNAEMQSMYDNIVWRLVVLLPNAKVVKTQLVANGCTQTYGIDYEETFSPVADIRAIRILIAIAAYYDYEIWQMDVKPVFLNGFLEKEIYMEQLEGFIDPSHPRKVSFILGIKIYRDRSRQLIGLSQNAYLDKIIKSYRMDNFKRGSILMQVDLHLSKSQCATISAEMKRMQNVPYASAVGSIMYVVRCTRPDVAFAQNITSRFQQNSAASEAAKEAVWIRKFIDELGVVPSNDYSIKMNCDKSAAIIMAKESGIQKGTKHFKRKYHYVHECIETGEIDIVKVHTDDNLADPFMKALVSPKLTRHARSMGLRPASSFILKCLIVRGVRDFSLSIGIFIRDKTSQDVITVGSTMWISLLYRDLWDALERQMRGSEYGEQDRKAAILYEYETFKANEGEKLLDTYLCYLQVINDLKKCGYKKDNYELNYKLLNNLQLEWKQYGDVNDALGYKKKAVVVTSDPLALVAEKTNVSKQKEKVVVSSDSEGSGTDDFGELKKITALLAKAFNRRKFYSKPTNNNLRTSSTSQSANKKQEFVKSNDKKEDKKADEKKMDMSKVKCYNGKKEGHFAKDYESSSSDEETIAKVAYYTSKSESEYEFETSEYYNSSTNYGLFVNNDDDQEFFHDDIESASENFIENHIDSQKDYDKSEVDHNYSEEKEHLFDKLIRKFNHKIAKWYTPMFLTHSNEALEIKKFKRSRENKIMFAYDYGNLNASYLNEKIKFSDDYFQEIINPDFEKIDSPFQQTSSLKPYVPNVILEKIIIDLEDEVVSLLEKEKANLKTIESLKSKGESSSSSLNDDVQQSPEEVILPQTNTQSISINMIPKSLSLSLCA
nr:hypothetical protein [Tanacetum cinerariifolium]